MTAARTYARTEAEVAANTIARLMRAGIIPLDAQILRRAADAAGVEVAAVKAAWERGDTIPPPTITQVHHGPPIGVPGPRALQTDTQRHCCRCDTWKPLDAFNVKNRRTGLRQSLCRDCFRDYQRQRYLRVTYGDVDQLVAVAFPVRSSDECCGAACAGCGQPMVVGERVVVTGEARHEGCPA